MKVKPLSSHLNHLTEQELIEGEYTVMWAFEDSKIKFDPSNCNHALSYTKDGTTHTYKAEAINCPYCLRHKIIDLEEKSKLFRRFVDVWTWSDTPMTKDDYQRMREAYDAIIKGKALNE